MIMSCICNRNACGTCTLVNGHKLTALRALQRLKFAFNWTPKQSAHYVHIALAVLLQEASASIMFERFRNVYARRSSDELRYDLTFALYEFTGTDT